MAEIELNSSRRGMGTGIRLLVMTQMAAALVAAALAGRAVAAEPDADEIVRRNFLVGKVGDSRAEVTMTLINRSGARRQRSTLVLSKLLPNGVDQKHLIRFVTPADVKGTTTLMIEHGEADDDIWIYLPALRKVRRLVASNKKDSFVGTDFSYGDIIGHRVEDWAHRLIDRETIDGVGTYVIESVPRSDRVKAESGYSRRKTWIRQDNFVAVKAMFWDTGGALLKESAGRDIRRIDAENDKWQPFAIEMRNRQTGHATEIVWTKMEVGVGLSDDQFTERYLEKES